MPKWIYGLISTSTPLILDDMSDCKLAVGTTKLRNAYSGYCMRVMRVSDNATQDIGFSGNNLDTASIATFCSGTTGKVSIWYDQSGAGENLTQPGATIGYMPTIYASGAVVVDSNSIPTVRFDGTDDLLSNTDVTGCPATNCSTYIDFVARKIGSNQIITQVGFDWPNDLGQAIRIEATNYVMIYAGQDNTWATSGWSNNESMSLCLSTATNNTRNMWKNGTTNLIVNDTTLGAHANANNSVIIAEQDGDYCQIDCRRFMIFAHELTSGERTALG